MSEKQILDIASEIFFSSLKSGYKEQKLLPDNKLMEITLLFIEGIIKEFARGYISNIILMFLNKIVGKKDAAYELKKQISALLIEPLKTGLEQTKIAIEIKSPNDSQISYGISRFRDALLNFDKAYNLATDKEKPFISLLRGLVTRQIPGAEIECAIHLNTFIEAANERIGYYHAEILRIEERISGLEARLSSVPIAAVPKGLGGGSFASIAINEENSEYNEILYEIAINRKSMKEINEISNKLNDVISALCEFL